MSDRPCIFVSAVSSEFEQTRQDVANILARLGFEPVLQDVFGTEPGDLRQILRDKIDACDGLLQIVGQAYGFEPPLPNPEFGRVSYTQFEYLYARQKKKKTWLILTQPGFERDSASDGLDVPRETDLPDPEAYRAERRALQQGYRERLQAEGRVWLETADETELEIQLERLRSERASFRRALRSWRLQVTPLRAAILLLAVVAGGVSWTLVRLHNNNLIAKALASLRPELIRTQLERSIHETYERDAADVRNLREAEGRRKALQVAEQVRDQKLAQLDSILALLRGTIASGEASPEFLEMSHILQEQGVNPALDYSSNQESGFLVRASQLTLNQQRDIRRTLGPLLLAVALHRDRGDLAEAERLCAKLLAGDADWPQALDQHVATRIASGQRALDDERPLAAWRGFAAARASAERLAQVDPAHSGPQRALSIAYLRLGELTQQAGLWREASTLYDKHLEIAKRMAAGDPADFQARRGLSASYAKAANLNSVLHRSPVAEEFYKQVLDISRKLEIARCGAAPEERDLATAYESLGDMGWQSDRRGVRRDRYEQSLEIRKKLAAAHPEDIEIKRDLAAIYEKLGALDSTVESTGQRAPYRASLEIRRKLAAANPDDAQLHRDLAASSEKLGDVAANDAVAERNGWARIRRKQEQAPRRAAAQAKHDPSVSSKKEDQISREAALVGEARALYEQSLEIRKKLAAGRPADAPAQHDLAVSYDKLASLSRGAGRFGEACELYRHELDVVKKLAADDPANSEAQHDLAVVNDTLGNVSQQSGQFDVARESYQSGLEIYTALATAKPANIRAMSDLRLSYDNLARFAQAAGDFDTAVQISERAVAYFERVGEVPRLKDQSQQHLDSLKQLLAECRRTRIIAGSFDALLKQPAGELPQLLSRRCSLLAARRETAGIAQAAQALLSLKSQTPTNLYNAARGYGLCAKLAAGWPGHGQFPPFKGATNPRAQDQKSSQMYLRKAIDLLQSAVKGSDKSVWWKMRQDPDLDALRDLPEFKKLLTAADPRGR